MHIPSCIHQGFCSSVCLLTIHLFICAVNAWFCLRSCLYRHAYVLVHDAECQHGGFNFQPAPVYTHYLHYRLQSCSLSHFVSCTQRVRAAAKSPTKKQKSRACPQPQSPAQASPPSSTAAKKAKTAEPVSPGSAPGSSSSPSDAVKQRRSRRPSVVTLSV